MRADVAGIKDAVLKHLAAYPDSKLSCHDLARVLGSNATTVRRACEYLYGEVKVWKVLSKDATRYQVHPAHARTLTSDKT